MSMSEGFILKFLKFTGYAFKINCYHFSTLKDDHFLFSSVTIYLLLNFKLDFKVMKQFLK